MQLPRDLLIFAFPSIPGRRRHALLDGSTISGSADSSTEKWDGILQTIRQENDLSNVAFKTWLLPLKVFRIEDHVLKITAPFEQAATYVENKYKTFLYVAVAEAMGEEYEIKIITETKLPGKQPMFPLQKRCLLPYLWMIRKPI